MNSFINMFKGSAKIIFRSIELDWDAIYRRLEANSIIEVLWESGGDKNYKEFTKFLYYIRGRFWEIAHATKACKPRRHNKHLLWIATGTYYHYLSSEDEDSNHHCAVMRLRKVNKIINSTFRMVG